MSDEIKLREYYEWASYLEHIYNYADDYIVICAIKDTPGNELTMQEIGAMRRVGFKSFSKQLWKMYIGIIVKGVKVVDLLADEPEKDLNYHNEIGNHNIEVFSSSWRKSNKCRICIDGIDYAVNSRGINIVIYDCLQQKVIDSVAYDGHEKFKRFKRNYLKFKLEKYKSGCSVDKIVRNDDNCQKVHLLIFGHNYFWNVVDSLVNELVKLSVDLKIVFFFENNVEVQNKLLEAGISHTFYKNYCIEIEKPEVVLFTTLSGVWPYNYDMLKEFVRYSKECYCLPVSLILNAYDCVDSLRNYISRLKDIGVKNYIVDKYLYSKLRDEENVNFLIESGNPKFDSIYKKLNNVTSFPREWEKLKGKKILLWLPDHDWDSGTNVSFDIYCHDIFSYFEENKNCGLIFRPHPHFAIDTIRAGIWKKEDEIRLKRYINNSENMVWDDTSDYSMAYKCCDYIFSDCASGTIISSMVTNKPIFILYRDDCAIINNNREILDAYYSVKGVEQLYKAFDMIQKGEDPLCEERKKMIEDRIYAYDGLNGRRIAEIITQNIRKYCKSSTIDLHTHSNYSDGQYSPKELMEMAFEEGIKTIALTDHDVIDGIKEAKEAASECGIRFIPGIEFSCQDTEEVHIIGLDIDWNNDEIVATCEKYKRDRENRAQNIIDFLTTKGIAVDFDAIKTIAGEGSIGRPHFAQWLVNQGIVVDKREAFDKYLDTQDFHSVVVREKPTPEFAIRLIHRAGGKAVLAHPGLLKKGMEEQKQFISKLSESGLDAIECFYSDHTVEQSTEYFELAKKLNLKISAGSDFHGEMIKKNVKLGVKVPLECNESFVV